MLEDHKRQHLQTLQSISAFVAAQLGLMNQQEGHDTKVNQ